MALWREKIFHIYGIFEIIVKSAISLIERLWFWKKNREKNDRHLIKVSYIYSWLTFPIHVKRRRLPVTGGGGGLNSSLYKSVGLTFTEKIAFVVSCNKCVFLVWNTNILIRFFRLSFGNNMVLWREKIFHIYGIFEIIVISDISLIDRLWFLKKNRKKRAKTMTSASYEHRKMPTRRVARFVPIGMPTVCWKTFPAKTTKILTKIVN